MSLANRVKQRREAATDPKATSNRMQLNLTSMIDVIFQLLIYFVITASFALNEGVLKAELPTGNQPVSLTLALPKQPLEVELDALEPTGVRIRVANQTVAGFPALQQLLIDYQFNLEHPAGRRRGSLAVDNPIVIAPTTTVRWQHVLNAYNAALAAEYTNVQFREPR